MPIPIKHRKDKRVVENPPDHYGRVGTSGWAGRTEGAKQLGSRWRSLYVQDEDPTMYTESPRLAPEVEAGSDWLVIKPIIAPVGGQGPQGFFHPMLPRTCDLGARHYKHVRPCDHATALQPCTPQPNLDQPIQSLPSRAVKPPEQPRHIFNFRPTSARPRLLNGMIVPSEGTPHGVSGQTNPDYCNSTAFNIALHRSRPATQRYMSRSGMTCYQSGALTHRQRPMRPYDNTLSRLTATTVGTRSTVRCGSGYANRRVQ